MSGGYSALDTMIKTIRNNNNLLRKVRAFPRIKEYNHALEGRKFRTFKHATPEQLAAIRAKTIAENQRTLRVKILQIGASLIVVFVLLLLAMSGFLLLYL